MSKAIFVCDLYPETSPPPMDSADGYCLHYTEAGVLHGGYSVIGNIPYATTSLVWVEASEDVLDQMAADPRYLFVEDVVEEVLNA